MGRPLSASTLSFDDYLRGEEQAAVRHEFLAGEVHAMAGASERHNRIALNLAFHLRAASRGKPCGVFIADMKLRVRAADVAYYPDVMLVCDPADDHPLYKERPCLVAEVLSPATAAIDRREKWLNYRDLTSLRYYLLIDADGVAVDVHSRAAGGAWQTATLDADEVLRVDCPPVQAALSLDDLYEDTGLLRV